MKEFKYVTKSKYLNKNRKNMLKLKTDKRKRLKILSLRFCSFYLFISILKGAT